MQLDDIRSYGWGGVSRQPRRSFRCGNCSDRVASEVGYRLGQHHDGSGTHVASVYVCPSCNHLTAFFPSGLQIPGEPFCAEVAHVPKDISDLYAEARRCTTDNLHTAAVLICRKILMNLAVSLKAKEGLRFIEYVEYLSGLGYVPPNGKHWVDHIRKKGNEAAHEIKIMNASDSKELLLFLEMLLRFIFEFPKLVPASTPPPKP